ncbi:hypothetical protein [Viscerimonas tarda]
MKKFILNILISLLSIFSCLGQEICNIFNTNWINIEYIRDRENYLPCECVDTINYCFFISIAQKYDREESDEDKIPECVLHYIIQTEPRQYYIIDIDSEKCFISGEDENWNTKIFELTFKGDTLLLIDNIGSRQFIRSVVPFDFWGNKSPVGFENINLFNKSLLSRGYATIQTILKEDSLQMDCNAWLGNRNMVYSTNARKSWVLEIKNGFLYIEKVIKHRDPLDEVKTTVVKKMKWTTNGKERLSRKEEYPVFVSPKL